MLVAYSKTPFAQDGNLWATVKLSRSLLKTQRSINAYLGHSKVVHRIFKHGHGRHTFLIVQRVMEGVGCSRVAQMWQKGGTCIAVVAEWMHNSWPMIAT